MNIDPELIEAIAAWLDENDYLVDTSAVNVDACEFHKPTPAQAHALLLALAKCEPVRGLVEAAGLRISRRPGEWFVLDMHGNRVDRFDYREQAEEYIQDCADAALAPFAEVE